MSNTQWATPTPLRPDGTNLLPFPVNALPPIIGDMAQAIATTTSTDVAMAGTSILSAVSYCFSGVYRMSAKRDHTEPLVLDTLTIAEPSFKKSPVMSLIKRPYMTGTRTTSRIFSLLRRNENCYKASLKPLKRRKTLPLRRSPSCKQS